MSTGLSKVGGGFAIAPTNMQELFRFCELLAQSDMVPSCYRNKPGNVMLAVQMGGELGLAPMQAIQNIAPINGRPAVWGDAQLALCLPHLDSFEEGGDANARWCKATRGNRKSEETFSMEDARRAKLTEKKDTPWQTYPQRMLKMRARSWVLRDLCPDILRGIAQAEEQQDIQQSPEVRGEVISNEPKPEPKQERKSEPTPSPATVPAFAETWPDKAWAGKPLQGAPGATLSDYAAWLQSIIDDPKRARLHKKAHQSMAEVEAVLNALLDAEAEAALGASHVAPDPIIEGLEREVAKREQPDDSNEAWGLEAPQ